MDVPGDLGETPPELLAGLARHEQWEVRMLVAADPRTPPEVCGRLSQDEHPWVRASVALNPSVTVEVLTTLAADPDAQVRATAAESVTAGAQLLDLLAGDQDSGVRAAVAGNAGTSPGVLARLAEDQDSDVRERAAGNRSSPAPALAMLAADSHPEVRQRVAADPSTPASVLQGLTVDRKWEVRHAVAANPACRDDILGQLAGDKSWKVRERVATTLVYRYLADGTVPGPGILERLAGDARWEVRRVAARHPGAPPPVLAALSADVHERVREAVAANRATSPSVLAELATDNMSVCPAAAHNPAAPPDALARMVDDGSPWTRLGAVTGLWRHLLAGTLERSQPAGLTVVKAAHVKRPTPSILGHLVPDVIATDATRVSPHRALDPDAVRLAVTIIPDGHRAAADLALLAPYAEAGISHVWRAEPDREPVIHFYRLEEGTYHLLGSAALGHPVDVQEPFPVTVDLADLQGRLDAWLATARTQAAEPPQSAGARSNRVTVLVQQARTGGREARREAAASPDTPPRLLAELAADPDRHVRHKTAGNAATPPEALRKLATDPQWHVRFGVARNSRTPGDLLPGLADDEHWEIRRAIASRWPVPTGLLDRLAHDPYREVRCKVASRPASPQALRTLATDPFRQVRREVAANPSTPAEVLAELAADDTEGAPPSEDPHLSGSDPMQPVLADLRDQEKESVRQCVARNPNTPDEVLTQLLSNSDPLVRSRATSQLVWRKLLRAMSAVIPEGLVLAERPLIRLSQWRGLFPDAVIAKAGTVPASRTDPLDPAAVVLAVTGTLADTDLYAQTGITWLWQVTLTSGPAITVHHLTGDTYREVATVEPPQELVIDEPFPVRLNPASLRP